MKMTHGVLFLLLAVIIVACAPAGEMQANAGGDTPGETVRLPPQWTPTPVVAGAESGSLGGWRPCGDAPVSYLNVGDFVAVMDVASFSLRLRRDPGLDAEITDSIEPGKSMQVVEGPSCSDGLVWWEVRALAGEARGWAAEGNTYELWLVRID